MGKTILVKKIEVVDHESESDPFVPGEHNALPKNCHSDVDEDTLLDLDFDLFDDERAIVIAGVGKVYY